MSFELNDSSFAPHVAVLFIRAEVQSKLPSGELSGNSVHKIDQPIILKLEGHDRDSCIIRLNEFIEELKKKCN